MQHPHHSPQLPTQYDPQHPYIPLKMFLTFPASQDDYYKGEGQNFRRFIFEATGKDTYTQFERNKYREFLEYWEKNKGKLPANVVNNKFWNEEWKFRWLTSQQFNIKNTIKAMQKYSDYLLTNRFNVTPRAQKLLQKGIFYVCGRDAYLRPILVFDVDKMMTLDMTEQDVIETQKYFFEKVLNFYLLPGQIETWVAVIDVNYRNLMSLVSPLKSSIGFLSDTFRNRMRIAYIVRIPASLSFLWRICKGFMQEQTAQKINFLDSQQVTPLLQYTNPSQLQRKYGGTQPQITQFWPPRTVQQLQKLNLLNFQHPEIISTPIMPQVYRDRFKKGKLEGHTISKILLKEQNQIAAQQQTLVTQAIPLQSPKPELQLQSQPQTQIPPPILSPSRNSNILQSLSTNPVQNMNNNNSLLRNKIEPSVIASISWPKEAQPIAPRQFGPEDFVNWDKLLF